MKRMLIAGCCALLLGALALKVMAQGEGAQSEAWRQADAAWREKSYARALELYRKMEGGDREEIDYRIAVSLGETQKWDEAIAFGNNLAARAQNKARIYYYLGRLFTKVPHQGWKLKDKLWRGDDYPKTEEAQKPQQVYLYEEDAEKTLDYFEKAKTEAIKARQLEQIADTRGPLLKLSPAEEIDLNFDLAAWVSQREYDEYIARLEKGETIASEVPTGAYQTTWPLPYKALYLYNEIPRLDTSKTKHDSALSLYAKGLWVRAYRQRMDGWAPKWDEAQKKEVIRRYAFDRLEPLPIWAQLVRDFPKDDLAPRAQMLIAQTHEGQGDLVKALAAYRELIEKFPKDRLVSDARAQIQNITRPQLGFDDLGQNKPGVPVKFQLSTRNLATVEFRAYRIKLEDWLTRPDKLNDVSTAFTSFENIGALRDVERLLGNAPLTWRVQTKDKKDYEGVSETLDTPLKARGAYAVLAVSGNVRFGRIVVISDLALLKKTDRDNSFVYVADAQTGKAVGGANVVLKEIYYDGGGSRASTARGTADDAGFFDKKLMRGQNINSQNVEAFAWVGDRYALTGRAYGGYWGGYGDNRDEARVYATTDRPVYRPEQKVYFRQILTRRIAGGDQQPWQGAKVRVTVNNPKGETIYNQLLTSSEFGTINGELTLPAGAPLGEYYIGANVENTNASVSAAGGNRFRVEEYKRPEFVVTVDAPDNAVRVGETVAATIQAKYYFGSPVPNATVKYTVRRSTWWSSYRFPTQFDWLYRYWNEGDYNTGRRNIGGEGSGTIVKEGTVKTDAKGIAEVSFKADQGPQNDDIWWRRYSSPLYTIEAEVTDASRRTIEAQGSVRVANQEYFAFLNAPRSYGFQGDRIEVEVRTQSANDKPLSRRGQMVVYKLLPGDKEEKVFSEAAETDATGKLFWTWQADASGQFRIAWEGVDDANNKVTGDTNIWIAGDDLNATPIRLQGVTIVLSKRDFVEGETLKALLIADRPDTVVLLTQEAGGQILKRDVVEIKGKSREISFTIDKTHVPNFAIAAAALRDYEVYQAQAEAFVPPVRQLINLKVTGDKASYKPGEKGRFTLEATDWEGKPVRAEVALALADASLFYIQKSYAPDIRTFYYGDRRAISVNLDSSRSGNPQARFEDENKYPQYETHGFNLPDDLGQLNLDPGGGWYGGYYGRRMRTRSAAGMVMESNIAADSFAVGGAMPMSAPAPAMKAMAMERGAAGPKGDKDEAEAAQGAPLAEAQVRENFAETAYWSPAIVTEGGKATVEVTFPDSLTQWNANAVGLTGTAQVGSAETNVETKKNLLLRMQAPRFFTERDTVILTANVHNYLNTDKRVKVTLQTGDLLENAVKPNVRLMQMADGLVMSELSDFVEVKAGEEVRVNWVLNVVRDGEVAIQMTAQTDEESDAVKRSFPVLVHGVQKMLSNSGMLSPTQAKTQFSLNIPKERRLGASQLNLQLNPSLAATMLDALPYLADYPYGCVEQTMSRFLPSVVAAKTLRDSGINLEQLRARAKAYEKEAKTEAVGSVVKNTAYTYPKGMPNSRDIERMARMWHTGRWNNPVFDQQLLDSMVADGLKRLVEMQRGDGGWGWWPGSGDSDEYMSAYVVYGLATAKAAGVAVPDSVLSRGYNYLASQMKDEDNIHLLTYIAYALSQRGSLPGDAKTIAAGRLFEQRERLTAYSKSLLAMALWNAGEKEKAQIIVRNLENTARIDEAAGTARWQMGNQWWYWWNNDVETNAVALRAFMQVDPDNRLAPMLMKWLVTKNRGGQWRSTKETAEAVYALSSYIKAKNELDVDYTLKVGLNGKIARNYRVTRDNALYFDNRFIAGDLFLQDGANTVTIEKVGKGSLYYSAFAEFFSLEEPIKGSGNAIAVRRRFFKLTRSDAVKAEQSDAPSAAPAAPVAAPAAKPGRGIRLPYPVPAQPREPEYTRSELKEDDVLQSGDLIEVELTIDSDNDYEYLVFEDMKAAGVEPVDIRSGGAWGDGLSSNVELRDTKVAFFVDRLPQGTRVLRYRVRAEVPGRFHALPTNGYAMYAPEVRAISDEMRVGINDIAAR